MVVQMTKLQRLLLALLSVAALSFGAACDREGGDGGGGNGNGYNLDGMGTMPTGSPSPAPAATPTATPAATKPPCKTPTLAELQAIVEQLKKDPRVQVIIEHGNKAWGDGCFLRREAMEAIMREYFEKNGYCTDGFAQLFAVFPEGGNWRYHTCVGYCTKTEGVCFLDPYGGWKCDKLNKWSYCGGTKKFCFGEPNIGDQPPKGDPTRICVSNDQNCFKEPIDKLIDRSKKWTECNVQCKKDHPTDTDAQKQCVSDKCYVYLDPGWTPTGGAMPLTGGFNLTDDGDMMEAEWYDADVSEVCESPSPSPSAQPTTPPTTTPPSPSPTMTPPPTTTPPSPSPTMTPPPTTTPPSPSPTMTPPPTTAPPSPAPTPTAPPTTWPPSSPYPY